jgi:ABC-type sugar transport system permease subunit
MAQLSKPVVKRQFSLRQQDARVAWLLLAPSLLVLLGVTFWPILYTFILSFQNAPSGINQVRTFVWLGNYLEMLKDAGFWETIGRTMYFTVASVSVELILGLAVAQLIHSHPWGWKFLRFALIIPWAVPTIVNGSCGAGSTTRTSAH